MRRGLIAACVLPLWAGWGTSCGARFDQKVHAQPQIFNGLPVASGAYPFFIHLPEVDCGASHIFPGVALTAAHCLSPDEAVYQLSFTQVAQRPSVKTHFTSHAIERHPSYGERMDGVDLALVFFDQEILPREIQENLVRLADPEMDATFAGKAYHAVGFGETGAAPAESLLETTLQGLSNAACQAENSTYRLLFHPETMLCADHADSGTCHGDSGGPLFRAVKASTRAEDQVQYGTLAWGGVGRFPGRCSEGPSVYTRIAAFLPWIRSTLIARGLDP